MLIKVKVFPESEEKMVFEKKPGEYEVYIKERAINNEASKAARNALAIFLNIDKSKVRLIRGFKERNKIFDIES